MATRFQFPGAPRDWPQIQVLRRIWRVGALLRALHQPHFKALDLPMVEFDLLSALGNTEGLRMKDLAEAMITTPSNVTRVCAVMEKKGLVERQRSSESDREVIARLTAKGTALFEDVFPSTVNLSAQILNTGLSRSELETMAGLLEKLLANLRPPDSDAG